MSTTEIQHLRDDFLLPLPVYEFRNSLYEELHTRPSPKLQSPSFVSHIALIRGENSIENEHNLIASLCQRFSVNPPAVGASCFYQNFGGFELRWEKHTEFSTYTFICNQESDAEYGSAMAFIPKDWLQQLPGEVAVAIHMNLMNGDYTQQAESLFFEGQKPVGSLVANGKAKVLTSFRLHSDGFGRYALCNYELNASQLGRLVQRLLELETYRIMALMGLPVARELAPEVTFMEADLAVLNQQIAEIKSDMDERDLLVKLSLIAARVEQLRSDTNYRFAATNAYHALIGKRLDQVFEQRISGMQTMREFLERRLTPGIRTCNSLRDRLEDLSRRIHRTTSMLRTRVEVSIESQNQRLLASMDRRSSLQLRLQQTVEGLSVVAIAYYLLSLLGYGFAAMHEWGYPINKTLASGIAMPVVVFLVYLSVRRHMRIMGDHSRKE